MFLTDWLQGIFVSNRHRRSGHQFQAKRRISPVAFAHSGSTVERLEERTLLTTAWVSQGPAIVLGGQSEGITDTPADGALHAVAAHPTNPDILYVGSPNGGIWKTTNATAATPTWTPLTDNQPSLSIGALEFDPTDATNQTLVAGFAQNSSFSNVGGPRIGLLKTTDGGTTWTVLDGSGTLRGKNISGVAARGNIIVVSVNTADDNQLANTGIFRSIDGGTTFTQISTGNGATTGLPNGASFDLVGDPNNPAVLYAPMVLGGSNGIYKSTNTGANWTKISNATMDALITDNVTNNIELAASRAGGTDNLFVGIIRTGQLAGLFRSGNGGTTFTQLDLPATNETPGGPTIGLQPEAADEGEDEDADPGSQGETHFSIVADPTNPNVVYVGGDRQPNPGPDGIEKTADDTFPNSIGANDFSGRLFRVDASLPAGSQAVPLTHNFTANKTAPHADSRDMVFDAAGNIIEVDDGGVYRRTAPATNTGDWFSMIGTLGVAEEHDIAYDTISNTIIGGAQDNGVAIQTATGSLTWRSVAGGDGGDVAVDDVTLASTNMSLRYFSSQNLGGFTKVQYNSSNVVQNTVTPALTVLAGGAALVPQFATPTVLNSVTPSRLLLVGKNAVYESSNQGDTITEIADGGIDVGTGENAVAYGHPANPDVIYLGVNANVMVRTALGGSLVATAAAPPGGGDDVRDVVLDRTTAAANTLFVVDQNQVMETINGGTSWIDITGNLAALGASAFRSLEFVTGVVGNAIVVGTGTGVYYATSANYAQWTKLGSALPNAPVFDLDYDAADKVLVAGTLGRGAFTMPNVVNEMGIGPRATVSVAKVNNGAEPATNGVFRVTQTAPSLNDTVVNYSIPVTETSDEGSDYATLTGTVTIPAGSTFADIDVEVFDDMSVEADETVIVNLTSLGDHDSDIALDDNPDDLTSTLDILDNDVATVSISAITDASESGTTGKFRVTQSAVSSADTVVTYDISGSALPGVGNDYVTLTGSVTIPAGATTADIDIAALDDVFAEAAETVTLTLTGFVAEDPQVTLDTVEANLTATVSITDNDTATFSINDVTASEADGSLVFDLVTDKPLDIDVTITVTFTAGSATGGGTDFTSTTQQITFPVGQTSKQVTVPINNDAIVEATETFTAALSTTTVLGGRSVITSDTATGTITDNDVATVSIAKITDGAESSSPTNGKFRITQSAVSSTDTVVNYTIGGTATPGAGNDYTTLSGTATIPAGQTTVDINVLVLNDALVESTETVIATLSGFGTHDSDITFDATPATVNITDSDVPTITSGATASVVENTPSSTVVLNVDADLATLAPDHTLSYGLSGPDAALFNIDSATGEIRFNSSPDFDVPADQGANNVYQVTVTATADTTPTQSTSQNLTITVTAVNDITPVFTNPAPTFEIAENTADGTVVGSVPATDGDLPAQTLTYSIVSGNLGGAFTINPFTGEIKTAASTSLNFEVVASFALTVRVTDNAPTARTADAIVTINVTNVVEPPTITIPNPQGTYRVRSSPDLIFNASTFTYDDVVHPNYEGTKVTVSIISGRSRKDKLTIIEQGDGTGQINTRGHKLFLGATQIGTFQGGTGRNADLVVTLNANATTASVATLIRRVNFQAKDGVGTVRAIHVQITNIAGVDSNVATRNINVVS